MYKKVKSAIKPLIKDPKLYKQVKAEIKKVLAQEPPYDMDIEDVYEYINFILGEMDESELIETAYDLIVKNKKELSNFKKEFKEWQKGKREESEE